MNREPAVFDTLDIMRTYKASPERVFTPWADPAQKRREGCAERLEKLAEELGQ